MELYVDEKWKLSKKASRNSSSGKRSSSSMMMASRKGRRMTTQRSFTGRCASLVKEQRAKFYIVRRCVTMLICWREYP